MVEFAFAFPVFLLLLLGLVDFGYLYSDGVLARNGTREAARAAAVGKIGTAPNCTITADTGVGQGNKRLTCLTKERLHREGTDARVKIMLIDQTNAPTASIWDPNNSLVVCTMTTARSITGAIDPFLDGSAHRNRTVIQIERLPSNYGLGASEETPLDGQNWAWCSEGL